MVDSKIVSRCLVVVSIVLVCMGSFILLADAEDVDAAGSGTQSSPYHSSVSKSAKDVSKNLYFAVGTTFTIRGTSDYYVLSITSSDGAVEDFKTTDSVATGTFSKVGKARVTIYTMDYGPRNYTWYCTADPYPVTGIEFTPSETDVGDSLAVWIWAEAKDLDRKNCGLELSVVSGDVKIWSQSVTSEGGEMKVSFHNPGSSVTIKATATDGSNFSATKTYNVIASYRYTFSVTFLGEGSTGVPDPYVYTSVSDSGHSYDIPSTVPVKPGHTFSHWLDESSSTEYDPGDAINLTADVPVTLIAVWVEDALVFTTYPTAACIVFLDIVYRDDGTFTVSGVSS